MRLWDWAVKVHGAPGVDEALIEVQDQHGQCVSYLLWAAWIAASGLALDAGDLARGAALARDWEAEVTAPLRAARRALKRSRSGVDDAVREALRNGVKESEFSAERLLMDALEALTPVAGSTPGVLMADRLRAASAAWSPPAPEAAW